MQSKKIVAIGELLWDLLPGEKKLGGAVANFAYRLNGLANQVFFVSRLGNDALGDEALKILRRNHLNTDYIQSDYTHSTGTVNVFFDRHRNPDYTIIKGAAYDFTEMDDRLLQLAAGAGCIVYGTLAQRSEISGSTINQLIEAAPVNAVKFCDINLRKNCYTKAIVASSLQHANIAKLNHAEAFELAGMFGFESAQLVEIMVELVKKFQLNICLVTLEAKGALAVNNKSEIFYSPGYKIKMEDPVGAGDAYSAAFVHQILQGESIHEALNQGNIFGAIVAGQKGAMQNISEEDLQPFRKNQVQPIVDKEFVRFSK